MRLDRLEEFQIYWATETEPHFGLNTKNNFIPNPIYETLIKEKTRTEGGTPVTGEAQQITNNHLMPAQNTFLRYPSRLCSLERVF